jgi:hypothetical protein
MFGKRYIEHLEKQLSFYQGKCERLELALMSQSTPSAQSYVERTEPKTIESTTVELPKKESWREQLDKWRKMNDEERDASLGVPKAEPKPEVLP